MSNYVDYDRPSRNYDFTRGAVGREQIIECLAHGDVKLDRMSILDAGCGTGSYCAALLPHVRSVTGLDISHAMLEVASRKFDRAGEVSFCQGTIEKLPFTDASFDGIVVNQVLHHLADDAGAGFPQHQRCFAELARVLRPGGALVIHTSSADQIRRGFWFYQLVPRAARDIAERFMPLDPMTSSLRVAGLRATVCTAPPDLVLQGSAYFDPRGPLDSAWRDGDSVWSLATKEEVEAACHRIRTLDSAGELQAFFELADAPRREIGNLTYLGFQKPASS